MYNVLCTLVNMNVFIINDCKFVVCKCNMLNSYCDISRSKLASRIMLVLYNHYRWRSVTSLSLKDKT